MSELSCLSKEFLSFCVKLADELFSEGLGDFHRIEPALYLLPVVQPEMEGTCDLLIHIEVFPVASKRLADVWSQVRTELLLLREKVLHAHFCLHDRRGIAENMA